MTGSIDTMSLSEARSDSVSDQCRLTSFSNGGETTYIGIVRSDNEDFLSVVDETEKQLAPPNELFHQWWNTKKQLKQDGEQETTAHNEALAQVSYFDRFAQYLNTDDAQEAITRLTERVLSGEDIVLVCYCTGEQQCHRYPVADRIEARL